MPDETRTFDLVVLGGGPGGYVCAIRAAQLGLKTAVIEKRPTLGELTDGLNFLMKKNKIQVFAGAGRIVKAQTGSIEMSVTGQDGAVTSVSARKLVIATGSLPIAVPGIQVDEKRIITSDKAIALDKVPERMIVIGAGVIGLELGSVWKRLGSKVTFIEMLPAILPGLDAQVRETARRSLEKQGLEFLFESKVTKATAGPKGVEVEIEKNGEKKVLVSDVLLVAVGRRPYADDSGAAEAGIRFTQRGRIEVNPQTLETSIPGIYAIGDVIDGPMLAHKAEEEGVMVAELIAGGHGHVNYNAIPFVVYTWPEVA
ncbi:MAG: FAD-dependent oxidoreductase, partial [Spirochaetia bacterium]|nr:FAD-dependent oxidoreductase [Spirochaetia bacterium]